MCQNRWRSSPLISLGGDYGAPYSWFHVRKNKGRNGQRGKSGKKERAKERVVREGNGKGRVGGKAANNWDKFTPMSVSHSRASSKKTATVGLKG